MPVPQMIETPAMRRSAMLAKLLEEQRQPVEIKGGYGELAARLLGQGITQFSANRAEKAVRDERARRTTGEADAFGLTLASVLRDSGGAPPATDMPPAAPPPVVPPVSNTQQPVEAMTAPVAAVAGSPMPPAAPAGTPAAMPPTADVPPMPQPAAPPVNAPQMAPQAAPHAAPQIAPQSAANPLGITPGEMARIQEGVDAFRRTGDPAIGAWVRGEIDLVRQRMSAPAAERREVTDQNGVKYLVDPTGATPPVPLFGEQGVPDLARTRNVVAGPNDPYGMVEGTTYSINPSGVASVVRTPSAGYRGAGGREAPITGGPQDPAAGANRIQNERELRREYQGATQEYRTVRQAFQKVEASLGQNTGIGDVGGIFGVMKIFDPGSTVREGEAATVQNSGGVPETIRGLYNRVVTGERLTPAQRAEIVAVGRAQFGTYEQGYQGRVADFTRMAEGYGIDPRNVVGSEEAPAPRPQRRSNAPTRPNQPASGNNDPLGLR
jgi:hypothetical protein